LLFRLSFLLCFVCFFFFLTSCQKEQETNAHH
jgi:hypothetical protein